MNLQKLSQGYGTRILPTTSMKRLLEINICLVFLFLYIPILVVVMFSFNSGDQIAVWEGFSLNWYAELFKNRDVWHACKNSLIIAGVATFISTIIGTAAALAIEKYRFRIRTALTRVLYLPLIIPDIVLAIALLTFYVQVKFPRGLTSVILAHVVFNIAYVTIVVRARLEGYDDTIEEAALDLGANRWQTFWRITFPLIAPGIIGGALLAFTLSIDDFVITFFTAGVGSTTLSVYIYSSLKFGITPELNAISTMLLVNSIVFILLFLWFRGRNTQTS
ncbi:MAG: ABC transporter permease [Candidatus Poribacteria bacterium]|nr:ABC transporter permease [Candidatus Poribacteria bacterium]